ncbi:MAG TPA: pyridoxamine 5'-phosphate oxidase family protein [Nitrospirae bacterium]|nr:pyridoxamine 5'-phosphate oxidase family protein [Nitrospirota bacterium]
MRKHKKEIRDEAVIIELLKTCHTGRLGTNGGDGYPMVKPLNFAYHDGKIYFHTALEGEKIDDIKRDDRVCFEVDLPIAYVRAVRQPCEAEYLYRSVIIKGRAAIVDDREERLLALGCLMEKYQPEGGYGAVPEGKLAMTGIVRIEIEEMTGKEDLGKGAVRDEVLRALREGARLPIVVSAA